MSQWFYSVAVVVVINVSNVVFSQARPVEITCDEFKSFFAARVAGRGSIIVSVSDLHFQRLVVGYSD